MTSRLKLYLMALCVVAVWGASFPLTKAALEYAGPNSIAFLRWAISALALVLWLAWRGRRGAPGLAVAGAIVTREPWTVAWLSITGITLYYFLQNIALQSTTATNAGVLSNLTSVFIVLIAAWLLHERLSLLGWLGIVVAFGGSALVSQGAGHLSVGGPGLAGDALMVLASFLAAVYSVGAKRLTARRPPEVVTAVVAMVGALFLLPLALAEGLVIDFPLQIWGILLVIGVFSGAWANVWWLTLLSRVPASRAALALFFIPVVAAVLSVTLLHEPVTLTLVVGGLLVLAGVLIVQRRPVTAANPTGQERPVA